MLTHANGVAMRPYALVFMGRCQDLQEQGCIIVSAAAEDVAWCAATFGGDHCLLFANSPKPKTFGTLKFLVIDMVASLGLDALYSDLDLLLARHPMNCSLGYHQCMVQAAGHVKSRLEQGMGVPVGTLGATEPWQVLPSGLRRPPFDVQSSVDQRVPRDGSNTLAGLLRLNIGMLLLAATPSTRALLDCGIETIRVNRGRLVARYSFCGGG